MYTFREMGRNPNSLLRNFFNYNGIKNESVCKTCGFTLKGAYPTNLKRHLLGKHKDLYHEEEELNRPENKKRKRESFRIELCAEEVQSACVDLVTKESLPFALFDSKAFKVLTEGIFQGLKIPAINSRNIVYLVAEKANSIKEKIKIAIKGKLISLKIDTATRLDRSVLGVNIQFINTNKIIIYTLAVLELTRRHTAENIKEEIEKVLQEFGINRAQVYSLTTDNGRNVVKVAELLSSCKQVAKDPCSSSTSAAVDGDSDSDSDDDVLEGISFENVYSVKCAAHTLQLGVKDFLSQNYTHVIDHARQLVKSLRTPTFRYSISLLKLKKPQLDVVTRWNSTFQMLHDLISLKDFCEEHAQQFLNLSPTEWTEIEKLVEALTPVNKATLKLQQKQLLFGDFYKLWLELKLELKTMSNEVANVLIKNLEKREENLLQNEVILSAIFLDPRLRRLLSKEKKEIAKKHLKGVAFRMYSLNKEDGNLPSSSKAVSDHNVLLLDESSMQIQSTNSLLRSSIRDLEVDNETSDDEECNAATAINVKVRAAYEEIDAYREKRIDIDSNLLDYWEDQKYVQPSLHKVALIVHGVPATQVSVERAFSALKLILSDRRYNLLDMNIRKLLFVKLNN